MYENYLNEVLFGFDFLNHLDEKDYRNDPTFDKADLRTKMQDIDDSVVNLFKQLPYESIGNIEEERWEMPDETMEEDDLEDEIVTCDRAIHTTIALLQKISLKYFNEPYQGNSMAIVGKKSSTDKYKWIMDRMDSYFPNRDKQKKKVQLKDVLMWILCAFLLLLPFLGYLFGG